MVSVILFYNKTQLTEFLRIGSEFLFIDEAYYSEVNRSVRSKYCLSENHWIFKSHLLGNPVFPGNLLSELSCQSAMVSVYQDVVSDAERGFLRSVNFTFFKKIEFDHTGNQSIECLINLLESRRGISKFQAKIFLGNRVDQLICAGQVVHARPWTVKDRMG